MPMPEDSLTMPAVCSLTDFDPHTLAKQFVDWGYKPSHAAQVLRAFYGGDDIAASPLTVLE